MKLRRWLRRIDAFVAVAIALAVLPIIVAVVRAIADGWIPLGDQALLQIRAHDVLTSHHPLLGTASSAALNRSDVVPLNHPGPLMFDVLALPVRVFGGAGVAIGVGLINMAATATGVVFAWRRAGRAGAALAALACAGLGWAAGSESLYDPYNPTAAMLPCLACLFLAWCAVDLDSTALLWLIGVSSFAVQLNNSYLLFLTPLVVVVCAVYVARSWSGDRGKLRAVGLRGVVVFVVLWSQPLLEQLLHGGDGNLARMVRGVERAAEQSRPAAGHADRCVDSRTAAVVGTQRVRRHLAVLAGAGCGAGRWVTAVGAGRVCRRVSVGVAQRAARRRNRIADRGHLDRDRLARGDPIADVVVLRCQLRLRPMVVARQRVHLVRGRV